ncbi:MAG TPA: GLPGLI family protein [Puia sp.]|jgi:GLPGLI family protein
MFLKKQMLLIIIILHVLTTVYGQVGEGRIVYKRKVNLHRRLEDERMKRMVPEFDSSRTELLFSGDQSLYRNIKEAEDIRDQAGQDHDGPVIRMKFGGGDDQTYKNYTLEKMTQQRELGPKKYIIEDSFPHYTWKMAADTQLIQGHLCKKAVTKSRQGGAVAAWYAEDIQCPSGPEDYGGLPGLILRLDINDGEMVFSTDEIDAKLEKDVVHAPAGGKKITRDAFRKMLEDQNGPGNGRDVIRIIRQ